VPCRKEESTRPQSGPEPNSAVLTGCPVRSQGRTGTHQRREASSSGRHRSRWVTVMRCVDTFGRRACSWVHKSSQNRRTGVVEIGLGWGLGDFACATRLTAARFVVGVFEQLPVEVRAGESPHGGWERRSGRLEAEKPREKESGVSTQSIGCQRRQPAFRRLGKNAERSNCPGWLPSANVWARCRW